jgi:hypothetical protein
MSESKPGGAYRPSKEEFARKEDRPQEGSLRQRHAPSLLNGSSQKPNGNGAGAGWDAYRRWLTRVQSPAGRRTPLDPSLYTWKGYRNWSDQVRRDWKGED